MQSDVFNNGLQSFEQSRVALTLYKSEMTAVSFFA